MLSKRGNLVLNIILFLLVVVVLLIGAYFLYLNLPGSPENLKVIIKQPKSGTGNLSYETKQFYPNMKFNHNSISYNIDIQCDEEKRNRMLEAFNELEERVGIISFYPASNNPDIEVSCSEDSKHLIKEDYFIAGEGGAKEIIQTGRYNVITQGIILLHTNPQRAKECDWPNIELHELLHVFGFAHSSNSNSLMYPYLESCNQKLDEAIIDDLKKLYSEDNLADLYFEQASAVEKGRYLDFNITVKNSGVIDADSVSLTVLDSGNKVDEFDLKDIAFGAGVSFYVENLKLKSRSSKDIELVIDLDDLIEEIDEDNNVAELKF